MPLTPFLLMMATVMSNAQPADWTPEAVGAGYSTGRGTVLIPEEGIVSRSLDLTFPGRTESVPGDYAQWSYRLEGPAVKDRLHFYLADDFTGPTAGYHFVQVVQDGEVLWERDVAGGTPLPEGIAIELPRSVGTLAFRLLGKKAVTNFPVRVRIAGVRLEGSGQPRPLLPLLPVAANYTPYPPDLPLPALPPAGGWSLNARIVQPWGSTQTVAIRDAAKWSVRFDEDFGFNAMIVLPTDAHNAITVGPPETAKTPGITDQEFRDALALYRAHDMRIIIYTSIMHCGHSPQWQFGGIAKEHPEWSMVDPAGNPITLYGHPWLCPSTGALEHTIRYTEELVRQYSPDAVMLDNNEFLNSDAGAPTCYCEGCKAGFARYIRERFTPEQLRATTGLTPDQVAIPQVDSDPLWGLWLSWRNRVWAEATETYRVRLRAIKPDIVVLANTQYQYGSWILAVDGQYAHEDAVLSESRGHTPEGMAAKMLLGRALAQNRPLWNYIGTFQEHDFTKLREPSEVGGVMAASSAVGANPWIVFYGFEGPENQASVGVIESQMRLWDDYPELFTGEDRGDVAVVMSPSSRDHTGEPMPARVTGSLIAQGYSLVGIWEHAGGGERINSARVTLATSCACMSDALAGELVAWTRNGGTLIIRPDTGWLDEFGRWRPQSALSSAAGIHVSRPGSQDLGAGRVVCVASDAGVPEAVSAAVAARVTSDSPVGVFQRLRPQGGTVFGLCALRPEMCTARLTLPDGAGSAMLYEPGLPPRAVPITKVEGQPQVSVEIGRQLAIVTVD
ncbi:MAG: beta-galactosidase [Armatimonadetes bacterium]|nr:beta-galactosidase [Armatimonadota bacterium]